MDSPAPDHREFYRARLEELEAELDQATSSYHLSCNRLEDAKANARRWHGQMQMLQGQLHELREMHRRGLV